MFHKISKTEKYDSKLNCLDDFFKILSCINHMIMSRSFFLSCSIFIEILVKVLIIISIIHNHLLKLIENFPENQSTIAENISNYIKIILLR